jgi:hypothetical protein
MRLVQPARPTLAQKWSASVTTSGSGQPRIWLRSACIVSASSPALSMKGPLHLFCCGC